MLLKQEVGIKAVIVWPHQLLSIYLWLPVPITVPMVASPPLTLTELIPKSSASILLEVIAKGVAATARINP